MITRPKQSYFGTSLDPASTSLPPPSSIPARCTSNALRRSKSISYSRSCTTLPQPKTPLPPPKQDSILKPPRLLILLKTSSNAKSETKNLKAELVQLKKQLASLIQNPKNSRRGQWGGASTSKELTKNRGHGNTTKKKMKKNSKSTSTSPKNGNCTEDDQKSGAHDKVTKEAPERINQERRRQKKSAQLIMQNRIDLILPTIRHRIITAYGYFSYATLNPNHNASIQLNTMPVWNFFNRGTNMTMHDLSTKETITPKSLSSLIGLGLNSVLLRNTLAPTPPIYFRDSEKTSTPRYFTPSAP